MIKLDQKPASRYSLKTLLWLVSIAAYCCGLIGVGRMSDAGSTLFILFSQQIGFINGGHLLIVAPWIGGILAFAVIAWCLFFLGRTPISIVFHQGLVVACFFLPRFVSEETWEKLAPNIALGALPLIALSGFRGELISNDNESDVRGYKVLAIALGLNLFLIWQLLAIRMAIDV